MTNRVSIIDWSEQLATGVPRIDAEHRRLIDLINELGVLHRSQATVAQLRAALADLRNYAEYHFQTEADLMQIHPVDAGNRRVHLAAHQGFVDQLERVNALVATDPAAVIEHLLAFMMKWLLHHITGVDARMAREIISLEMGISDGDGGDGGGEFHKGLVDTVSELYDRIGERTLELLQVNQRLNIETEQRKRAEEGLQLAAIVFANVNEAVMVTGANNCIIAVNPSFTRITGYASDEVISRNPSMLSGGINPPEFYQDLWRSLEATGKWEGEIRNRRKSGEFYVEWLSINRVRSETAHGITHHVGVFYDVTNRRAEADRIQRMAHYDLITSLPNRALLEDRAHQTIAKAVRDGTRLAVMFLDLDRFKRVNDTHGHSIGDRLLNEAAVRLQACLRASDTVARIGGDEFVVLLPEVEAVANAMTVAQKMRESLNQPFEFDGKYLHISCSIGIALFPGDGINEKQLIEKADAAMYRAKKSGRNRVEPYPRGATEFVK